MDSIINLKNKKWLTFLIVAVALLAIGAIVVVCFWLSKSEWTTHSTAAVGSTNYRPAIFAIVVLAGFIAIGCWKWEWVKTHTNGWTIILPVCTLVVCVSFWGFVAEAWSVIATSPSTDPARGFVTFCGLAVIGGLILLAFNKKAQESGAYFVGSIVILTVLGIWVANYDERQPRVTPAITAESVGSAVRKHGPIIKTETYVIQPGEVKEISTLPGGVTRYPDDACWFTIDSKFGNLIEDYPGNKKISPAGEKLFYRTASADRPLKLTVVYYQYW